MGLISMFQKHIEKNIDNILFQDLKLLKLTKTIMQESFLGKSGTTFMVDTFGIHKGSPVKKGTRMALILEFGSGHFPSQKECLFI